MNYSCPVVLTVLSSPHYSRLLHTHLFCNYASPSERSAELSDLASGRDRISFITDALRLTMKSGPPPHPPIHPHPHRRPRPMLASCVSSHQHISNAPGLGGATQSHIHQSAERLREVQGGGGGGGRPTQTQHCRCVTGSQTTQPAPHPPPPFPTKKMCASSNQAHSSTSRTRFHFHACFYLPKRAAFIVHSAQTAFQGHRLRHLGLHLKASELLRAASVPSY